MTIKTDQNMSQFRQIECKKYDFNTSAFIGLLCEQHRYVWLTVWTAPIGLVCCVNSTDTFGLLCEQHRYVWFTVWTAPIGLVCCVNSTNRFGLLCEQHWYVWFAVWTAPICLASPHSACLCMFSSCLNRNLQSRHRTTVSACIIMLWQALHSLSN
jgi:hypothetical protein